MGPFYAMADDPVGPANDSGNSPVVATANAPYVTATIGEHDDEHIATTAYVKGAYNDAIAAVNKVNDTKQNVIYGGREPVETTLLQAISLSKSNASRNSLVSEYGILSGTAALIGKSTVKIYTAWDTDDNINVSITGPSISTPPLQ